MLDLDGLDLAPIPIQAVDATGTIVWANRALLDLVGVADYVGQPVTRFANAAEICARLARGETVHDAPLVLRACDGVTRHCVVSAAPGRGPWRWFLRDVTAQRAADAERDRLIADLGRTVQLNDTFAGILGHDLRGPLSTIVMASQLMLSSVDDPRNARALERVLNSADRMQRMIDQLLDFARARVDGGIGLERKPADVAELARDVIEEVRVARPAWKLELVQLGDTTGELDGNRLSQVFSNLINNATQHGSPEAPLRVTVDGRGPMLRVTVENRGTIPADVLPVLFSATRGTHGSQVRGSRSHGLGLGLFITDHIVRAHGGRIAATSADGVTAFRFELPRRGTGTVVFDRPASSERIPIAALVEASPSLDALRADEALRLRDEFLSLASHELKTPLTVLQLQLEALREQVADRPTLAKLDRSTRAVKRLTDLTEALLDVSRIATGRFQLQREQADIADVVGAAVDRLHETAETAGCRLAVCADHVVGMWDRSRIDQVVSNLIANAIRYAAGAPIDVAVTHEDAGVAIEVRDRGPGLPDGTMTRIFERFERAASMRHYGGLGLGLYVVRQITEAHGGSVTAHNLPAGGACFTVRLPIAAPASESIA